MSRVVVPALSLFLILISSLAAGSARRAEAAEPKPNLLFLFADDQCFETIRALGNDEIQTPNLDALVARGTTFTHAYNQGGWHGAVCVASRTMLVTGRYLWHAEQAEKNIDSEFQDKGQLWPQLLQSAGYRTYFSGKWHVKAKPEKTFQVVNHVRGGMPKQTQAGYNRPVEGQPDQWDPSDPRFGGFWEGGTHWSEVLKNDAVEYLRQAAGDSHPFFMYLAFNAPHDPRQSPREYVERYPLKGISTPVNFLAEYPYQIGSNRIRDEQLAPFPRTEYAVKVNRQEYYAIITHMDAMIGEILKSLQSTGQEENTYIFFTADHGLGCGQHGLLGKQNMYDHSVRVPLMVVGPGIEAARRIDAPVYLQDIMPTTLELAGVTVPDHVEFQSLLPALRGDLSHTRPAIYGAYTKTQRMVTEGDYKLIVYPSINRVLLFNVKTDPHEMHDLAEQAEHQSTIARLASRLRELQRETGDTLKLDHIDAFAGR